ncbi:AAA family ATPase [Winogradskyella wichelsiae]|uniref:AAA family ATPase n=1 Tax=Winogradskyella wichelsiae TaxID=2697007 RepID=UPI003EF844F3
MIEKIIEISNIGHFVNFKFQGTQGWNGELKKLNIIYAPNGSGKTTLATILKSLSKNNLDLITYKKTFGTSTLPKVKIKASGINNLVTLKDEKWSNHNLKIEVFDINYIEDYLFAGSYVRKQNKTNLFKLLFGNKGSEFRNKMKPLINKKDQYLKKLSRDKTNVDLKDEINLVQIKLDVIMDEFNIFTEPIYAKHVELVNKYLSKFTSYISLKEFSYLKNTSDFEKFRIFPIFKVYDEEVVFASPSNKIGNARYSMSEGDKSTVALCFFLARLEVLGVSDKIIVFDDPISSFDYSRRNSTIFQLAKIVNSSIQFILLSHDLGFTADFSDKCSFIEQITLKIENNGETSFLNKYDINSEFLTSTQKDIEIIKEYLNTGVNSESDKREVVRCIRPVLEGVFKSKYFDLIPNNIWLGDIIELIKQSSNGMRLYQLKTIVDDIIELNDYTKSYHHSTGNTRDLTINNEELKRYINLLITTIDKV